MKLFIAEPGTEEMVSLFDRSEDRTLFVSVLAAVEVRSAVRRREAAGDLNALDAAAAIATLTQETGRIIEYPISASAVAEAVGVVDRHRLRTLDAMQLGCALVARSSLTGGDDLRFAASDERLLDAAHKEGLLVWNPERPTSVV